MNSLPVGTGRYAENASRAKVRSAWTKFKESSLFLIADGASFHIKEKIYMHYA